jgi:hypothetical protein
MNHKFVPAVAALMIVGMLLSLVPLSYAQTYSIGPSLSVVTIPQDNQVLKTGVIILGLSTTQTQYKYMAQYKLTVTYNGEPFTWQVGATPPPAPPTIYCYVFEKDKVNVVPDPKTGDGKQGWWENLATSLVDVSSNFECKPRWTQPDSAAGWLESVGVLDVYYVGPTTDTAAPFADYFIADNILVVQASYTAGTTLLWGSDIQDVCVLGWAVAGNAAGTPVAPTAQITKPDGTDHWIWANAFGNYVSCESLALAQRAVLGIPLATAQDYNVPLSTTYIYYIYT